MTFPASAGEGVKKLNRVSMLTFPASAGEGIEKLNRVSNH